MSSNETYELFGGVLYNTPVDETSEQITSDNFQKARCLADTLLATNKVAEAIHLVKNTDINIINYMNSPLIDFLLDLNDNKNTNQDIYYNASTYGNLNIIKYLQKFNEELDLAEDADSSMCAAAGSGHLDIVKYLNESFKIKEFSFNISLQCAVCAGSMEVIQYLVEHGAKIDNNMILNATTMGRLDIIKYLHEHGVDVHGEDGHALQLAASSDLDIVKYLVEAGADIHWYKDQPLLRACRCGLLDIVKYLVEAGAYIHESKYYSMEVAAVWGRLDVVRYLVNRSVDLRSWRENVITTARKYRQYAIIEYLQK